MDKKERRERNAARLMEGRFTSHPFFLGRAEFAVFEQEDLERLLEEGAEEALLCGERFVIPTDREKMRYFGLGHAVAVIPSDVPIAFDQMGVYFFHLDFDENYEAVLRRAPEFYATRAEFFRGEDEPRQAICNYLLAAEMGSDFAEETLEDFFEELGEARVEELFLSMAEVQELSSMNALRYYYKEREEEAYLRWLEALAERKSLSAMAELAFWHDEHGDPKISFALQKKIAEMGDPWALTMVGIAYLYGDGTEQDVVFGKDCLEIAAELGNASAMCDLGKAYDRGIFYAMNPEFSYHQEQAFYWFRAAAEAGNSEAMFEMARSYHSGIRTVAENCEAEYAWLRAAVALGNANAMRALGGFYLGEANYLEARYWFEQAAGMGELEAVDDLGLMYLRGQGGKESPAQAFRCFQRGAEESSWAMLHLAQCYEYGYGTEKDENLAKQWYEKAAAEGNETARVWVNERVFTPEVLAELLSVMIHGKLVSGKHLWHTAGHSKEGFFYRPWTEGEKNKVFAGDENSWLLKEMETHGETVLGGMRTRNAIVSAQGIFFTQHAFYIEGQREDHRRVYRRMDKIEMKRGRSVNFLLYSEGEESPCELKQAGLWQEYIDLDSARLFLLVVSKLFADSDYEFSEQEKGRLEQIELDSLEGNLMEYLKRE